MPEQPENNPAADENNKNLYPYQAIQLSLKDLLSRFGNNPGTDFLPLVIDWGFKGPFWQGWPHLKWEELLENDLKDSKGKIHVAKGAYLELLNSGKRNIGIRTGPGWGNLGNFDIDVPNRTVVDTLLSFCPQLADTLWTKGSSESGHSIWFRTGEDWPAWALCHAPISVPDIKGRPKKDKKTGEIKENDNALELRTQNGIQSVIFGLHENKKDHYAVVNDKPIIRIEWKWIEKIIRNTAGFGWRGWPESVSGRTSRGEGRWTNSPLGYAGNLERRLEIIEELGYEILDVEKTGANRIKVRCPNVENHSTAEKEGEAVIFPGTDTRGVVAFKCLHKTCAGRDEDLGSSFNQRESFKLHEAFISRECLLYRHGNAQINETYDDAYGRIRDSQQFYNLNRGLARWRPGWDEPDLMNPSTIQDALNEVGIKVMHYIKGGSKIGPMKLAGADAADLLAQERRIRSYLPEIQFVSNGKLPWWNQGDKTYGLMNYGYNPELKCLCLSQEKFQPMTGILGLKFLDECLLSLWNFETPEDKSRALCMVLSIAQSLGRWYEDRGAFHLITADRHQAGKTLLIKCIGAIYGIEIKAQDQEEKGIGSVKERLNKTVSEGKVAFLVDNIEGEFKSTLFELLATSGANYDYRQAYEKIKTGNIDRMTFFFTGNEGFETRNAMASRLNIVKILYRLGNFEVNGESVLSAIQKNSLLYRSAIAAVLLEYAGRGAPRKKETEGCDFRFADYTRANNGLLDFYGWPLLTTGLAIRQQRAADPDLIFAEKLWPELAEISALEKVFDPDTIIEYLETQSDLVLPKCEGKRLRNSVLSGRLSKLLRRLPPVRNGVTKFGPGFCHISQDSHTHRFSFIISRSEETPNNPGIFEL